MVYFLLFVLHSHKQLTWFLGSHICVDCHRLLSTEFQAGNLIILLSHISWWSAVRPKKGIMAEGKERRQDFFFFCGGFFVICEMHLILDLNCKKTSKGSGKSIQREGRNLLWRCDSFVQWHRYVKLNELLNPVQTDFSGWNSLGKKQESLREKDLKQKRSPYLPFYSLFLELCHINFNEAKCLSSFRTIWEILREWL